MDTNKKEAALAKLDAKGAAIVVNLKSMTTQTAPQLQDSLTDLLVAAAIIEAPLSDGIQWFEDLLEMIRSRKYIEELVEDFSLVQEEFNKVVLLDPEVAINAIINAYASAKQQENLGRVTTLIANTLYSLTSSANAAYDQVQLWQKFLNGDSIIPEPGLA